MPSDLSGVSVYERARKRPSYFTPDRYLRKSCWADEINRASPKTQSALLEAMEEKQVTVEGETRAPSHTFLCHCHQTRTTNSAPTFALNVMDQPMRFC